VKGDGFGIMFLFIIRKKKKRKAVIKRTDVLPHGNKVVKKTGR
jgi:preprotein translocase subunit YajC